MSKKKRVFDIDFDGASEVSGATVPAGTEQRRGPMAAAITENADALQARQSAEAAIRAENDALAHEHVRLKKAGLITDLISLDQVKTDKLSRDRAEGRDAEIDELKRSIREIGLSNPIRVEAVGESYELIQGFRRFTAYQELFAETGEDIFARIPAAINAKGEDILRLYRRMVDENMVRRGVSFGEMAQLAINYRNQDPNIESYDRSVELLFASSGRQKRSYIKHFVRLLIAANGQLQHPQTIARSLGLLAVKRLEEHQDAPALFSQLVAGDDLRSPEDEQTLLADFVKRAAALSKAGRKGIPKVRKSKTTFRLDRPEGEAKCTVADGRVELRLARDFSGVERKTLEQAVEAFLAALDQ